MFCTLPARQLEEPPVVASRVIRALPLLLLAACWAPQMAPSDGEEPVDQPTPIDPQAWPSPPFTAWTLRAPASIVGPGGAPLAKLDRAGVRVEVLQVLPVRARLRCTGCRDERRDVEGWLQSDLLWWPGATELSMDSPLRRAQELRDAWAKGQDLPETLTPPTDGDALCALLDTGWSDSPPRWHRGGATLMLEYRDEHWLPTRLNGVPPPAPGACARTLPETR
ncbi:MAG: hypothetical protein GXP62_03405 [Oligoflexia bacterium]|nr:hypothetical protein [Oligoflexia bacterium]